MLSLSRVSLGCFNHKRVSLLLLSSWNSVGLFYLDGFFFLWVWKLFFYDFTEDTFYAFVWCSSSMVLIWRICLITWCLWALSCLCVVFINLPWLSLNNVILYPAFRPWYPAGEPFHWDFSMEANWAFHHFLLAFFINPISLLNPILIFFVDI